MVRTYEAEAMDALKSGREKLDKACLNAVRQRWVIVCLLAWIAAVETAWAVTALVLKMAEK